jgi:hypothetical protein
VAGISIDEFLRLHRLAGGRRNTEGSKMGKGNATTAMAEGGWSWLVGRTVEVRRYGKRLLVGEVEQTSADGSVLWIAAHGAQTRRLFDSPSGYEVVLTGTSDLADS